MLFLCFFGFFSIAKTQDLRKKYLKTTPLKHTTKSHKHTKSTHKHSTQNYAQNHTQNLYHAHTIFCIKSPPTHTHKPFLSPLFYALLRVFCHTFSPQAQKLPHTRNTTPAHFATPHKDASKNLGYVFIYFCFLSKKFAKTIL